MSNNITLIKEDNYDYDSDSYRIRCENGGYGRFINNLSIEDIQLIQELCCNTVSKHALDSQIKSSQKNI